jgi:outer membrane receptor for ferric coprogen and ferric-rhodotorulic acid
MEQNRTRTRSNRRHSGKFPRYLASVVAVWGAWHAAYAQQSTAVTDGSVLPAVTVKAQGDDTTTEGSGSYVARETTLGFTHQSIKETPNSVSVVTRQRMDDQNMTSLEEALRYTTGINATTYGDGTAYYTSRGYNVGIEYDGVSIADGIQYLPQLDLAFYDRVEVFRGPAGLLDGAGEPGGTVNMVRKRPTDTFHFSSETQVQTFGGVRQMIDVSGPLNQDKTLRGRVVIVGGDNKTSIDAERSKEAGIYGALDYDLSPRTTLSLSAAYEVLPLSAYDYGASLLSTGQFLSSSPSQNFSPRWNHSVTSIVETNAKLSHQFDSGWKSETTLFYRHELSNAQYAYSGGGIDPTTFASDYTATVQRQFFDWFGADTHVSGPIHLLGRDHTLTFGANYSVLTNTSSYGGSDLGNFNVFDAASIPQPDFALTSTTRTRYEQYGVYGQARIHVLDPLTLVLGGRETFYNQETRGGGDWSQASRMNGKFIPYAGLVYDIVPSLSAYVSYSKIFAPQTQTTVTGEGLAPRTGNQYEVGLKSALLGGRLTANVAAFRIDDNNRAISDGFSATGYIAGGKARSQGWEAEITGQPLPNWNVYAGYTLLNTRYLTDPTSSGLSYDPEEPQHLFKLWTSYRLHTENWMNGITLGGGVLAQSQTARSVGYAQGGYAIYNAQVGYQFNKRWSASLTVNNLFDRQYYARVPSSYFGVFGDRRNAMLTVRANY